MIEVVHLNILKVSPFYISIDVFFNCAASIRTPPFVPQFCFARTRHEHSRLLRCESTSHARGVCVSLL